jgi:hypothetical protein
MSAEFEIGSLPGTNKASLPHITIVLYTLGLSNFFVPISLHIIEELNGSYGKVFSFRGDVDIMLLFVGYSIIVRLRQIC